MRRRRDAQRGMTLLEVLVSLWILAFASVGLLVSLGSATDAVVVTTQKRQMRHLAQVTMAEIEIGKLAPDAAEPFAELDQGTFEGEKYEATVGGDEYRGFEFVIEALRDELLAPGATSDEDLMNAGFEQGENGRWNRTVFADDLGGFGGLGGEEGMENPADLGPMKRLAIVAIQTRAEEGTEPVILRIFTYLPHPDEETTPIGGAAGEGGAAAGAPGGAPGLGGLGGERGGGTRGGGRDTDR